MGKRLSELLHLRKPSMKTVFGKRNAKSYLAILAVVVMFSCSSIAFSQARIGAERTNAQLAKNLRWNFSRKPQKGWKIYKYLIAETCKTNAEFDSKLFADAVAVWQANNGIYANGVVDAKTLYRFIKYWQSRRLKPIKLASKEILQTATIRDFWDPKRPFELRKLERETYKAYKRMVEAAKRDGAKFTGVEGNPATDESFLKIISAYRSPAYQASLRRRTPGASRGQLAFRSPHFSGRALDIFVGGDPVTTNDYNRAIQVETWSYKWLVKNAESYGFYPYFYEPWHWEYVGNKTTSD